MFLEEMDAPVEEAASGPPTPKEIEKFMPLVKLINKKFKAFPKDSPVGQGFNRFLKGELKEMTE